MADLDALTRRVNGRVTSDVMVESTQRELSLLFEVTLADPPPGNLEARLLDLGRQLDRVDARRALVEFLAPKGEGVGGARLVIALAEILFVEREGRTEYRRNRSSSAPWEIRRLLLEYALWSRRVDRILSDLTKGFCAKGCDRLPAGCCVVEGFDMGVVPEMMLEAQRLEAKIGGWAASPSTTCRCTYHGEGGCQLRLFKSPACIGMLCDALVDELRAGYETAPLEAFLRALFHFRNHDLDRAKIFSAMEQVVNRGQPLVAS